MALSERAQNTVVTLIAELESRSLPYAIARNYENYPDFGHDLDLYFPVSANDFESVAETAAVKCGWDVVTRCGHWSCSPVRPHNIDVFFFYRFESGDVLQVDLFQGVLVWGIPLLTASDIVETRERHAGGLFYRPNLALENAFRALQIAKLSKFPDMSAKVSRYKNRLESYLRQNRDFFFKDQVQLPLKISRNAVVALENGQMAKFRKHVFSTKVNFVCKFALRHPVKFCRSIYFRGMDYYRFFHAAPCGLKVRIYADSEANRDLARTVLDSFSELRLISAWREKDAGQYIRWCERRLLERAGVLVEWLDSKKQRADLSLSDNISQVEVRSLLLKKIVCRHTIIFMKSSLHIGRLHEH